MNLQEVAGVKKFLELLLEAVNFTGYRLIRRTVPEEENTLFLNDLEEELAFSSVTSVFSWRKFAKIADFFKLKVSRYHLDGFTSHFWMTSSTFELLANFLAPSEQMHLVSRPLNKENK